jgi:chromosome segregation ATPase
LRKALSKCSKASDPQPTRSEIDAMQIDKLLDEVRLLREQNCELEKELRRVKNDLCQMTAIVDEVEKQRQSNEELEGELEKVKSNFTNGISQISSKYQTTVNEKFIELTQLESRLQNEKEKASCLEKKVCKICEELSHLKEYREKCCELKSSLNCAQNDHYEKAREAELFKKDCQALFKENQKLKCEIEELKCEIEKLQEKPNNQQEVIRKSVVDFKRHYDEKLQLIRCYEDKIKILENENNTLRCSLVNQSPNSSCK